MSDSSCQTKIDRLEKLKKYLENGLVKIPDISFFVSELNQFVPKPLWYLQARSYRKKHTISHTKVKEE